MFYTPIDAEFRCGFNGVRLDAQNGRVEEQSAKFWWLAVKVKNGRVRDPLRVGGGFIHQSTWIFSAVPLV